MHLELLWGHAATQSRLLEADDARDVQHLEAELREQSVFRVLESFSLSRRRAAVNNGRLGDELDQPVAAAILAQASSRSKRPAGSASGSAAARLPG